MQRTASSRRFLSAVAFVAVLMILVPGVSRAAETLTVDRQRNELRIQGVIQKNPGRPIHGDWGKKSTAFVGVRGGSETEDFIVVMDVERAAIYDAALNELGWQTGRTYDWHQTFFRRGFDKGTDPTDFMTGDPLLCILEFDRDGRRVRIPLEEAIQARIEVDGTWVEVPYTPHFVFTGAGEKNGIDSGCLVCPSDCVGGVMTDNSVPVMTEVQQFLVDWDKLPAPGEPVMVILRSIR